MVFIKNKEVFSGCNQACIFYYHPSSKSKDDNVFAHIFACLCLLAKYLTNHFPVVRESGILLKLSENIRCIDTLGCHIETLANTKMIIARSVFTDCDLNCEEVTAESHPQHIFIVNMTSHDTTILA